MPNPFTECVVSDCAYGTPYYYLVPESEAIKNVSQLRLVKPNKTIGESGDVQVWKNHDGMPPNAVIVETSDLAFGFPEDSLDDLVLAIARYQNAKEKVKK